MTEIDCIVLCKIAREISNDEVVHEENMHFEYKKKTWRLYEYFEKDATNLILKIKSMEGNRSKKLCCFVQPTPLKNSSSDTNVTELVLGHFDTSYKSSIFEEKLAAYLLPVIFQNYKADDYIDIETDQGDQEEDELLRSYVTTQLYDALYRRHLVETMDIDKIDVNMPESFKPTLRNFQTRSVQWLLKRERQTEKVPAYFTELKAVDGQNRVYKHKYCLQFKQVNEEKDNLPMVTLPPGGILADEMGLGKTVELLALILLHPRRNISNSYWKEIFENIQDEIPVKRVRLSNELYCICAKKHKQNLIECTRCQSKQHQQCVNSYAATVPNALNANYICPMCWTDLTKDKLIETGGTFIVTPNTIKMQWQAEIYKHTEPNLRVLLYEGMNAGRWISPAQIAEYDVVITDYDKLGRELYHTADYKSDRLTRQPPRFMRPTSPLMMINWWRVCLDEAQMVESSTSKAAELTRMLPACNRWAVTGTPIQRSIEDLMPLLRFVGFQELYEPKDAWETLINGFLLNRNSEALISLLRLCMWRTSKPKVQGELGIPAQKWVVHELNLSNVEMLYYREEHASCSDSFTAAVQKYIQGSTASRLAKISPRILKIILQPMLKIRQCCTMPVVQCKSTKGHSIPHKQFMHPKELLEHLKSTNEQESKSILRSWASSFNGIAAIYFIQNDYSNAIKYYTHVIDLAKQYNTKAISVDSLLQIHAIHNMLEAHDLIIPEKVYDETQIETYQQQLNTLESKYLESYTLLLNVVQSGYKKKMLYYEELTSHTAYDITSFVALLLERDSRYHPTILHKIREDIFAQGYSIQKLEEVTSIRSLLYVIDVWYGHVKKVKKEVVREFQKLEQFARNACKRDATHDPVQLINFIQSVSECHLKEIREKDKNKNDPPKTEPKKGKCKLCQVRTLVNQFECLLFAKEADDDSAVTEGLESPALEVVVVKIIFSFLKGRPGFMVLQRDLEIQWEILDCLQSLCKTQIKLWIEIEYLVKAYDELDMCKTRLSVTDDVEEKSHFCILRNELNAHFAEQECNLGEAQLKFSRVQGRLKYLQHLEEDTSDRPCPICQCEDDERYVVFECGHFICYGCLEHIKNYKRQEKTTCPLCRTDSIRLYYSIKKAAIDAQNLNSNYSTKITCIVHSALRLRSEDPATKILVFSQWEPILKAISKAFDEVGLMHRAQCSPRAIEEFKDPKRNITCMLMPFLRGSKGLNLIEATHVFLVEPILNPGEELQAIGRVHRFGQTKSTTVHRFIVSNTIEENIFHMMTSSEDGETINTHWEMENLTLDNLKNLFKLVRC